jgi:hypothetical protein
MSQQEYDVWMWAAVKYLDNTDPYTIRAPLGELVKFLKSRDQQIALEAHDKGWVEAFHAIQIHPKAEVETGQFDDLGRCELEGYVSLDINSFNKLEVEGRSDDYITIPLAEWEKYQELAQEKSDG